MDTSSNGARTDHQLIIFRDITLWFATGTFGFGFAAAVWDSGDTWLIFIAVGVLIGFVGLAANFIRLRRPAAAPVPQVQPYTGPEDNHEEKEEKPPAGPSTPARFLDIAITASTRAGWPARRPAAADRREATEHATRLMGIIGVPVESGPSEVAAAAKQMGADPEFVAEHPFAGRQMPSSNYRLDFTDNDGVLYEVVYIAAADDEAAIKVGQQRFNQWHSDDEHLEHNKAVQVCRWDGDATATFVAAIESIPWFEFEDGDIGSVYQVRREGDVDFRPHGLGAANSDE